MTTVDQTRGRLTGGQLRPRCPECGWRLPAVVAHGAATSHADVDRLMPAISEHISSTGHTVRVTLLTIWTSDVEETDIHIGPRAAVTP